MEPLFQVKIDCAHCGEAFRTSRVRPSFRKTVKTDADFCLHYKDVNPDYYVVRVCPHCGYASTENFSDLTPAGQAAIQANISEQWQRRDFGGERSREDAIQAYKLALVCAQLKKEKRRVIAGLLHHIAWLYREQGDGEQERRFLQHALNEYMLVYETGMDELNQARLMYLIGELNRRLKHYHEAARWFSRVVNDKRIMDAAMIRASREQWAVTREEMRAEQGQLKEEAQEVQQAEKVQQAQEAHMQERRL